MVTDFRPLPLLSNPHLQTVFGNVWREAVPFFLTTQRQAVLPDGDRLVLHDSEPPGWRPGDRVVLLLHGLGGSHRSAYMERLTAALLPWGLRVVRLDLRGVGRGVGLARRTYHGGLSDDVRAAVAEVRRGAPGSPVVLVGVSLGGNIALKLAGEAADRPVPGLERVAALSPPIDLVRCAELLAQRRNLVYESHYVRNLVAQVQRQQRYFPDLEQVHFPGRLTLRQFDDLCTAPRWGFAGALDYYRRASALPLIPHIKVPAFILTARDDPFIAAEPFEALRGPAHLEILVTRHGGHLGFLGRDGAGGIRWAEQRIVEWVVRK